MDAFIGFVGNPPVIKRQVNINASGVQFTRVFKKLCERGSDQAKYLIFYIKSSKNGYFLVLNMPFWVQNCWSKDFLKNTIWLKRSFLG